MRSGARDRQAQWHHDIQNNDTRHDGLICAIQHSGFSAVILNVGMLSAITLSVVLLNVGMLSVVILSVVATVQQLTLLNT